MAEPDTTSNTSETEIDAMVRVTRAFDPTLESSAVRRFWSEVAELEQALPPLEAERAPLASGYSPHWPEGQSR